MKKRILIVEDEPAIRRLMTMALEPTGYDVVTADDGPMGLARFGVGAGWDAVLLDQRMPGMEGLEVLRRIKAITTAVPVIMITAYPSIDLAVDAMKIGAVDFLRKPVTPDILRSAVAAALQVRPGSAVAVTSAKGKERPDIEMITMNGFRIVHESSDAADGRHRFLVFSGASETGAPVVVQISKDAMASVERLVGRPFDPAGPHWEVLAEDYLAAFLWNDQHIPTQPIVLKDVTADDLNSINFWPTGK
ncbi:MAG: response regulator [Vicinamibacterales bacterium]|jgi:DNA-binding response OmpR family regulator